MLDHVPVDAELAALRSQVQLQEAYSAHLHAEHAAALGALQAAQAEVLDLRRQVEGAPRHAEHAAQLRAHLDELQAQAERQVRIPARLLIRGAVALVPGARRAARMVRGR